MLRQAEDLEALGNSRLKDLVKRAFGVPAELARVWTWSGTPGSDLIPARQLRSGNRRE